MSRFSEIIDQLPNDGTREEIGGRLLASTVRSVAQLRAVVRGMNRVEATALLQRNIPDLTELDASALAGVLLVSSAPAQATAAPPGARIEVDVARKRRWDGLNTVLDINKKARMKDGHISVGYSYANWEQVKGFFPLVTGNLQTTTGDGLPEPLLTALHQYLSFATICFGSITEGHEAKRVHFIAPIVIIVCSFFNGDIQILAEEEIEGTRVHAHGHFEFVLKRGSKRICIVEAKKDDILQGKTQSLVGCESLCDVEDLSVSYGIATNYLEWCFLKDEAEKVTEEMLTISLESGRPTIESLRIIANKIIAILE